MVTSIGNVGYICKTPEHVCGMCTVRFGSYGAYKWHVYRKVWIEGLDRMVLTSGMCTGMFESYGAYKWHVYQKV